MIDRLWLKLLVETGRSLLWQADCSAALTIESASLIRRARTRPPRSEAERLLLLGLVADIVEKSTRHREPDSPLSLGERAVLYVQAHSRDRGISRGLVAEALGVSSSWLGHHVKQDTGMSFIEHLTEARLTDARGQLCASAVSTKEAALTAGFPSANAFTKLFRRRYRMTPTAWRVLQGAGRRAQGAGRRKDLSR